MTLLILLAFVLGAVAVVSLIKAVTEPRTRADVRVQQIELYGYRQAESAVAPARLTSGGARALAQKLGDFVGDRFGTDDDSKLRRELLAAGLYNLNPRALVGYQVLTAILGALYGFSTDVLPVFTGPIVDTVLFGMFGWVVPITYVRRTGRLRLERIDRKLPDVIDLIVVAVEAGQGFAQAMQTAADRTGGPLGDELKLTLQEQRFGLAIDRALENLNNRADTPNMRTFVRGVVQGERLGVSIGQIMRNIGRDLRLRRRQDAEERAQKTTVKILIPLVFLILPALIIVMLAPALLGFGDVFGD